MQDQQGKSWKAFLLRLAIIDRVASVHLVKKYWTLLLKNVDWLHKQEYLVCISWPDFEICFAPLFSEIQVITNSFSIKPFIFWLEVKSIQYKYSYKLLPFNM